MKRVVRIDPLARNCGGALGDCYRWRRSQ